MKIKTVEQAHKVGMLVADFCMKFITCKINASNQVAGKV